MKTERKIYAGPSKAIITGDAIVRRVYKGKDGNYEEYIYTREASLFKKSGHRMGEEKIYRVKNLSTGRTVLAYEMNAAFSSQAESGASVVGPVRTDDVFNSREETPSTPSPERVSVGEM